MALMTGLRERERVMTPSAWYNSHKQTQSTH